MHTVTIFRSDKPNQIFQHSNQSTAREFNRLITKRGLHSVLDSDHKVSTIENPVIPFSVGRSEYRLACEQVLDTVDLPNGGSYAVFMGYAVRYVFCANGEALTFQQWLEAEPSIESEDKFNQDLQDLVHYHLDQQALPPPPFIELTPEDFELAEAI